MIEEMTNVNYSEY